MFRSGHKNCIWVGQVAVVAFVVLVIWAGVSSLETIIELFPGARGGTADIVVDTKREVGVLPTPWRNLAQGRGEYGYRFEPILEKLGPLEADYIRIDHVYDVYDVVGRTRGGQLVMDWSKLDVVLDGIEKAGAKPFVSLSYVPGVISSGGVDGKPMDWGEWQYVVQKTVEHISGRSNRNVAGVYYEVWSKPDLFGQWQINGDRSYMEMYEHSALGARAAVNVNRFKFGGPATSRFSHKWMSGLLDLADRENLQLDFVSWHRYDLKVEKFEDDLVAMEKLLAKYPRFERVTEKIISGWGHKSEIGAGHDNSLAAAHTVGVMAEVAAGVDRAFVSEIQDGPDPDGKALWGQRGLMTHNDSGAFEKPRYKALTMLNMLRGRQLFLSGDGTWVSGIASMSNEDADSGSERVVVVLTNYDYRGRNIERVPITFVNITPGRFRVEQEFLNGRLQVFWLATTSGELKHEVTLEPNSVVRVLMERVGS